MTKGVVTATINSNEKIQQVEGWTLSEDKKSLKKNICRKYNRNGKSI